MAKASKVEQIVAEMNEEKRIVDACVGKLIAASQPSVTLENYSHTLAECIARLTGNGNGAEAPKPKATRKRRTASETVA